VIVVSCRIEVQDPSRRDAVVAGSAELQRATREQEAGCLAYCFAADPVEDARIQVYELWADAESLAAHFEHANYHALREYLRGSGLRGGGEPEVPLRPGRTGL
jgi:quinol monooxygenase YgiN